jgi:N-acetylmuramoyl-L-alanine amidase
MQAFLRAFAAAGALFLSPADPAAAQDLTALARFDPALSSVRDHGQGLAIDLAVSQPVPYRVSFLDSPPRLIVDFREVDFAGADAAALDRADRVATLGWGPFLAGWSRLVAVLDGPQRLVSAEEVTEAEGRTIVRLRLAPTTRTDFAAAVESTRHAAQADGWDLPAAVETGAPLRRQTGEAPLKVVLDPGHGGLDPGAGAGRTTEAEIMLAFALELAETLRRAGVTVELTRTEDVFVPLETRISIARAAGADVFLSLHADALAEGEATGATVYKLAEQASDSASAQLAERHDRADLLAGIDLSDSDDEVATVLMDLARAETGPRADRLARTLETAIKAEGLKMHRHPIQEAAFSVLKSADIPSLLLELGFLSSERDRERLADPVWRAAMEEAILKALSVWAIADAAEARLLRQ